MQNQNSTSEHRSYKTHGHESITKTSQMSTHAIRNEYSSCPRVEDLDRYGPVEDPEASLRCSTMQTALQLQVIFDEVIKIGMSVTVITAHSVLLVLHYKGIWCVSRVVDFAT